MDVASARRPASRPTTRRPPIAATCAHSRNRRRSTVAVRRRRVVHVRRARTVAKRARSVIAAPIGIVSQSMLRPTGTAADHNPMPQLLDLDDRVRDMHESEGILHRLSDPR